MSLQADGRVVSKKCRCFTRNFTTGCLMVIKVNVFIINKSFILTDR